MPHARRTHVIAERRFLTGRSEQPEVLLRIAQPFRTPDGSFACCYTVETGTDEFQREVFGVDSLQALLLALKMLTSELDNLRDEDFKGQLSWEFSRAPGDLGLLDSP